MITDVSEFKKRLQDIQQNSSIIYTTLPSNEPRLIIDANSREISIPVEFDFLAVKNDHKAETIYFEIDRYFDNHDLSEQMCVIQWLNQNDEGISPCTALDVETFEGKIIFGWEITSDCTRHAGDLRFSVRFYSIDDIGGFIYNFNTLPAVSKVLDTLDSYGDTEPVNPSTFQVWVDRLYLLERNCVTKDDLGEIGGGGINGLSSSDGSITIVNTKDDGKDISIAVSAEANNAIIKKDDGLYVSNEMDDVFGNVVTSIGCTGIAAGTSLQGKTVKDVLIMLLGIKEAPKPPVEYIMENRVPSYKGIENAGASAVAYQHLDAEAADYTDQCFYTTMDDGGEITSAGYQIVFDGNANNMTQTFSMYAPAKIVKAYQYQPALNQWLDMGFDGTYWVETGVETRVINGEEVDYATYSYNVELMGDVITATEYWRFEVEV